MSKHKRQSARRLAAQRANAQKSRGPVTPEGKARSAANAVTHGLASTASLAASVCLCNENQEGFAALHAALTATYNPADPGQAVLIQEMAVARWRQQRLWLIEGALMDKPICTVEPTARAAHGDRRDDRLHLALAFEDLADHSKSLPLLERYEARLSRQYQRCLTQLLALQQLTRENAELPNEANPKNEHQPDEKENTNARTDQPASAEPSAPVSAPVSPAAAPNSEDNGACDGAATAPTASSQPAPAVGSLRHRACSDPASPQPAPETRDLLAA
ncbi:MAG: hypothetical protein IT162_11510 [Bryobacterales bacterium]|nr:hypothetical protein [Bryobacterales bacterium]